MHFIVNRTKQLIVIGDLGFELKPKQAIDLELIYDKSRLESSKDLKSAIRGGLVSYKPQAAKAPEPTTRRENDPVGDIKNTLRSEMQSQMSELIKVLKDNQQSPARPAQIDQSALLAALQELTGAMKKGVVHKETVIKEIAGAAGAAGVDVEDIDVADIDPEVAAEMHAKAVDRMSKDLSSEVKLKEKKTISSIKDKVSELDNLLG